MTERKWLSGADPGALLDTLRGKVGQRELRLFACACCRSMEEGLTDPRSRNAVAAAERFADGRLGDGERMGATAAADQACKDAVAAQQANENRISIAARHAATAAYLTLAGTSSLHRDAAFETASSVLAAWSLYVQSIASDPLETEALNAALCGLLRDIFGYPFRPVILNAACLTPLVIQLAQEIYDDRAFERLPELARTLEEKGCDNQAILQHCRRPGTHVRGCWALDLILASSQTWGKTRPWSERVAVHFQFPLYKLFLVVLAYSLALGITSRLNPEWTAYGFVPGTALSLLIIGFRRKHLFPVILVAWGTIFGAVVGGACCHLLGAVLGGGFFGLFVSAVYHSSMDDESPPL